ncbi:MAG: hypothetical protein R3C56_21180 [Pirellulaceae bacterium]
MPQQDFTPLRGKATSPSIEDRWEELRANIRRMWPDLSKDDLKEIGGDSRKLIALVHQKTSATSTKSKSVSPSWPSRAKAC